MFLPSLEARYQQHPHMAFTCTPQGSSPNGPSSEPSPTPTALQDLSSAGPNTAPSSQDLVISSAGTDAASKEANAERVGTSFIGR